MATTLRVSAKLRADMGKFIRQVRYLLELTQAEFAEKLGVALPTITRWENHKSQPSPMAMRQLRAVLHDLKDSPHRVQQICAQALLVEYFDEDL